MGQTTLCPYCSEEIQPTAKKCKHCGEWLEVAVDRAGAEASARGSVDARAVARGIKEKESQETLMGCGTFLALVAAVAVGVWSGSWLFGALIFFAAMVPLAGWYYKE